ncbi:transposase family protein [Streptomyces sp. NPDC001601]|uniref:transposase family protein n=1 Tax=Streptomyces sp. NPDC001601 TaxID=3364592 RepID=UPI0036949814
MLDRLPDPRRVRSRRYRLESLLALSLLAVLGGATTLAGIARYAIDTSSEARAGIGLRRPPRATTLGRLLSRLDGDALDDAVGAWLARHASDPADERAVELVGATVDGKPYVAAAPARRQPFTSSPPSCTRGFLAGTSAWASTSGH